MTTGTISKAQDPAAGKRPPGRDASAWTVHDLTIDARWIHPLDAEDRADLLTVLRAGHRPGQPLLDYRRRDFPFGSRVLAKLKRAFEDALNGRGVALVKGLPREGVSPEEFELLTWAIGLHVGVARPQDKLSRYINMVKDVGADYRSPTGRGYSSRAQLDFHIDGADIVALSCYNQAPEGGDSMCTSSVAAYRQLLIERPDLAEVLREPFPFSRQGEQKEGEVAFRQTPIYDLRGDNVFCGWNRNRVINGARLPNAPEISATQHEAMDSLDEILRRPNLMYLMRLEAGDLQLLSNHTALHSRTEFRDDEAEDKKRTLYRLWLSMPDAPPLPPSLAAFWGAIEPGIVRGGIEGHHYDDACQRFDSAQAEAMGMRFDPQGMGL
ncbi:MULTISPECIES: TauD/TfdA family dioxygenase [unclassified Variovorax]|uniref:TauD/TfdA family dioxygenase n=1 Tax=unclassified Variovorax TaxID=663243 RepID=UPI001BD4BF41|nr:MULTISPECIES: TauD/TfdA family dioxygenase [unclassified Variovorax]